MTLVIFHPEKQFMNALHLMFQWSKDTETALKVLNLLAAQRIHSLHNLMNVVKYLLLQHQHQHQHLHQVLHLHLQRTRISPDERHGSRDLTSRQN